MKNKSKTRNFLNKVTAAILIINLMCSLVVSVNAVPAANTSANHVNPNVVAAQQWVNDTYTGRPGFVPIPVDGCSYSTTFSTLVEAFQIELGFSPSSITGYFGDLTKAASPTLSVGGVNNINMVTILQHALLCKGYFGTEVTGSFDPNTSDKIVELQTDAGLSPAQITQSATPIVLQAALSTEIYTLALEGDSRIRDIQQILNRKYFDYIGIQPCDGVFGANTNTSLIMALQAEEGIPRKEDVPPNSAIYANGNFGNTTKSCCPFIPYTGGQQKYTGALYSSTDMERIISLFKMALYCYDNGGYNILNFEGIFDSDTVNALTLFQQFVALPATGNAGLNEWMALMVSTGNPDRPGTAIDTSERLTGEKASALVNDGYTTVGRYLTGDLVSGNVRVAKNLLRSEMQTIFDAGLNLFVIYQDIRQFFAENPSVDTLDEAHEMYFSEARGRADAEKAFSVSQSLGVPDNEIIYFAVDYDFMKHQVERMIIPYFKGINDYANEQGNSFRIGIYSARNTCSLVSDEGYAESSFVSDMSTGYSGNLGYPLPSNWAFDQVKEYSLPSSDGSFGIDKDIKSGRYGGFNQFKDDSDIISQPSSAHVLKAKTQETKIPVYWAKAQNSEGKYVPKYPMYDYINADSFFVMKNRENTFNDSTAYVYFRDVGGRINAGYIDADDLNDLFYYPEFQNCAAYPAQGSEPAKVYPVSANDESYNYEFVLKQSAKSYDHDGHYISTLPANTKVRLQADSVTDGIYINKIQASQKLVSGSWVNIDPDPNQIGYIDLGMDKGVKPSDRNLISDSTNFMHDEMNKKAIYFLPGYLGSQLYDERDNLVWVNYGRIAIDIALRPVTPWIPLLGLNENGDGGKLKVSAKNDQANGVYGTELKGQDSGLAIMDSLKSNFEGQNYDIVFFPYDWRKSIKFAERDLRKHINENGYKEVSLASHSTGGLVIAAYIAQSIENNELDKIDKVVTIAGPLLGTFTSHEALETGDSSVWKDMPNLLTSYIDVYGWTKDSLRNTPCSYQLMPSDEFLISGQTGINNMYNPYSGSYEFDSVTTASGFYSILNLRNLNNNMINGSGESHKKYRQEYLYGRSIIDVFSHVDALHLAGSGIDTHKAAFYKFTENGSMEFVDYTNTKGYSDRDNGDGTVVLKSALMEYQDRNGKLVHPKNGMVFHSKKNVTEHSALLSNGDVHHAMNNFIANGIVDTPLWVNSTVLPAPNYNINSNEVSISADDGVSLRLAVNGKADINIVDENANIVASIIDYELDGEFANEENNDFDYMFIDEETFNISIPNGGYKVVFTNKENNAPIALSIMVMDTSGCMTSAAKVVSPDLALDDIVVLDAMEGISAENIENLTLSRENNNDIPVDSSKIDFSTELSVELKKIVNLGQTLPISYTVSPLDTAVTWSSSDENIAVVDEHGQVTGVGYGFARITAATIDGNFVETCFVEIPYAAESIAFEHDYEMIVGTKLLLKPIFIPAYATNLDLVYASSNTSVLMIGDDGLAEALDCGIVTVTATTDNNKIASCTVTVSDTGIKTVESINLTAPKSTIEIDESVVISAQVNPVGAAYTEMRWQVEDSDIAVMEIGAGDTCSLKGMSNGTTTVKVTVLYATEVYEAEIPITVSINYAISYDANGGTGAPASQVKLHDVELELSRVNPTRIGYTFLGWAYSPDATVPTYLSGGSLTANADAVLFAVWQGINVGPSIDGDYTYTVSNGQATIIKYTGKENYLTIPSRLGGYDVVSIGSLAFFRSFSLISVEIPSGITTVGFGAFNECVFLTSVKIPNGLLSIENYAFYDCCNLTSIGILHDGINMGALAFDGCDDITIYCYENSYAHKYALGSSIDYDLIESPSEVPAEIVRWDASLNSNTATVSAVSPVYYGDHIQQINQNASLTRKNANTIIDINESIAVSNHRYYTSNWATSAVALNDCYWEIKFFAGDFSNIKLNANIGGTATSPKDFIITYSYDGVNFSPINQNNSTYSLNQTSSGSNTGNTFVLNMSIPDAAMPSGIDDTLTVRLSRNSMTAINGGNINGNGNSAIFSISFSGIYIYIW